MRIVGRQRHLTSCHLGVLAGLVGAFAVMACGPRQVARDAPDTTSRRSTSIPLKVTEVEPGHYRVEVAVRLGDGEAPFLLDTGAPKTQIVANERTAHYRAVRAAEGRGVGDVATPCDDIVIDLLELGNHRLEQLPAHRCKGKTTRNLLGLDALGERFRIDMQRGELIVGVRPDEAAASRPLKRLRGGHVTIPARLGDAEVHVLFDTGADTTVIDSEFVAAHPSSFVKKRVEEGRDANGTAIASEVYALASLRLGDLELHDVEVAAIPFSAPMRRDMGPETPAIVGANAIAKGVWTFDLRESRWDVTAH